VPILAKKIPTKKFPLGIFLRDFDSKLYILFRSSAESPVSPEDVILFLLKLSAKEGWLPAFDS